MITYLRFSLKIPKFTLPPVTDDNLSPPDPDLYTPETLAVNKLEQISREIMVNFPDLLEKPILQMLNITSKSSDVNYDTFTKVAKPVYEMQQFRQSEKVTVWSRVAMVLYVVKETFFLGNLNDKQMELLVEHSTKFFTENAMESVKNEGGWEVCFVRMYIFCKEPVYRFRIAKSMTSLKVIFLKYDRRNKLRNFCASKYVYEVCINHCIYSVMMKRVIYKSTEPKNIYLYVY